VEYSRSDRHRAYVRDDDRRASGGERRRAGRRQVDRAERLREIAAFASALSGGLVVLYLFFVIIATIDVGDAVAATVAAIILALIWLFSFWRRRKMGAAVLQRPDRERRGF
jgi:protein-S-isoprenylcysteine O-methyltransferase Ste14